jgi:uncharacterized membrane protein YvbJ
MTDKEYYKYQHTSSQRSAARKLALQKTTTQKYETQHRAAQRSAEQKPAEKHKSSVKKWIIAILLTVNLILFFVGVFSCIWTSENNRILNSFSDTFYYTDKNGEVELTLNDEQTVSMKFTQTRVKIYDSYLADTREDGLYITLFIHHYAEKKGYEVTKSNTEMFGEYSLHNFLYNGNFRRDQTADADIDFLEDRRWYVNAVSTVIGWLGMV